MRAPRGTPCRPCLCHLLPRHRRAVRGSLRRPLGPCGGCPVSSRQPRGTCRRLVSVGWCRGPFQCSRGGTPPWYAPVVGRRNNDGCSWFPEISPMRILLLFPLVVALTGTSALAQGTPVPRYGSCPTHSQTQGGSCFPNPGYSIWWNNDQQCPNGVLRSKGYCVRSDR